MTLPSELTDRRPACSFEEWRLSSDANVDDPGRTLVSGSRADR